MKKTVLILLILSLLSMTACTPHNQANQTGQETNANAKNASQAAAEEALNLEQATAEGVIFHDDGTLTLPEGASSFGFFSTDGHLYENEVAKIENGELSAVVQYQQNYSETRKYLLIMMVDYEQHEFIVDNNICNTYCFSLEGDTTFKIPFTLCGLDADASEIEFLIFNEPDYRNLSIEDDLGWTQMHKMSECYAGRLRISDTPKQNQQPSIEGNEYEADNDGLFLSESLDKLILMPRAQSGQPVNLILGNPAEENCEFALVAFCGWEQINLSEDSKTVYTTLNPRQTKYYQLDLPTVTENQPYQIVAFEKPFSENVKYVLPGPYATYRTLVMTNRDDTSALEEKERSVRALYYDEDGNAITIYDEEKIEPDSGTMVESHVIPVPVS